jgi:O-acetyl-ADP-ribose deacetylase (regulator of RNase III)
LFDWTLCHVGNHDNFLFYFCHPAFPFEGEDLTRQLLHVSIQQGSILDVKAQVIVNAANSRGIMGGGVAGVIRRAAGQDVEMEAVRQAPIPVGNAVYTSGGRTKFQGIIHAPTMPEPAMRIPAENVALATKAALTLADEQGITSVALPGMGTGVGGISPTHAAANMINEIRSFLPDTITTVILVDVDQNMVQAWRDQLATYRE